MRLTRTLLATIVTIATLLLAPTAANAVVRSPYGHLRITYRNASTYKWQVTEAFAVWNRAGTPYTFAPALPGRRADITVTQRAYLGGAPNSSIAGYGGIGFVQLSAARLHSPKGFHNGQVKIVAHEIGHALGLAHSPNQCSIMYSSVDFPGRPRCATVEKLWDNRQFCGPRGLDVLVLGRRYGFRPRVVAWRGYCTTPTDPAKATTGPYVAATITGSEVQHQDEGQGVQLTLTNTGNVAHDVGSMGLVAVDANGAILADPWGFGQWYYAFRATAPGESLPVMLPPCRAELPAVLRVRIAAMNHDAFLSPVLTIRLDETTTDPAAPVNECGTPL